MPSAADKALWIRGEALDMALRRGEQIDVNADEFMALCVFFEAFLASGATQADRRMKALAKKSALGGPSRKARVVQLITRDD